jgi:hypothetical protein
MANLGTLSVYLTAKSQGLEKGLSSAQRRISSFVRGAGSAGSILQAGLFGGAIYGAKKLLTAWGEQEDADARLRGTLTATSATAEEAGKRFERLSAEAAGIQDVTVYGDEAAQAVQSILTTAKGLDGDQFKRATELAFDLSSVMGTDATSAAKQLAKALGDPVLGMSALGRAGVIFTESEKDRVRAMVAGGRADEARGVILDKLAGKVGGVSRAMAQTTGGKFKMLANFTGELSEALGKTLADMLGIGDTTDYWIDSIKRVTSYIQDHSKEWAYMGRAALITIGSWFEKVGVTASVTWDNATVFAAEFATNATALAQWFYDNWAGMMANLPASFGFALNVAADLFAYWIDQRIVAIKALWEAFANPTDMGKAWQAVKESFTLFDPQKIKTALKGDLDKLAKDLGVEAPSFTSYADEYRNMSDEMAAIDAARNEALAQALDDIYNRKLPEYAKKGLGDVADEMAAVSMKAGQLFAPAAERGTAAGYSAAIRPNDGGLGRTMERILERIAASTDTTANETREVRRALESGPWDGPILEGIQ